MQHEIWLNDKLTNEEFEFLPLDNIGSPTIFKVLNWGNVDKLTFKNAEGESFTRFYLHTTQGLLALSSVRLQRQLKVFADSNEKGELVIQRWCEGKDTRSTTYKVELVPPLITTKKPKPAPRKTKKQ